MRAKYAKYIDYIECVHGKDNGNPKCRKDHFDEDWEPIGDVIIEEMSHLGLIKNEKIDGVDYIVLL